MPTTPTTAVYARKSTEQTGTSEDARSVTVQVQSARAFAASKGLTVEDRLVFADDGVSGAEFAARPGYIRLLDAAKRREFDVLIIADVSRLGREQLETGYALKQLSQAGVTVWSYLEAREILLSSATDKFLMSAANFAAEVEREKARQRTADTMVRKANNGHV